MRRQARIVQVSEHAIEAVLEHPAVCTACKNGCSNRAFDWLTGKNRDRILIVRHVAWTRNKRPSVKQALVDTCDFFGSQPKINQRFTLEFNENSMLKSALWLYAMPLALMVAGLGLGHLSFVSYGGSGDIGGIVGLMAGLLAARFLISRRPSNPPVRFS